jgi:antitoxin component of MazEF toxin-antitoxin module
MFKVLFISSIYSNKHTGITKDIIDLLGADIGDDILFVVDEYGVVKIRKSGMEIKKGEKYIGASHLVRYAKRQKYREQSGSTSMSITGDVRQAINVDIGDDILWILDQDGNIILRNNIILEKCSFETLNKNVGALIIGLSTMSLDNNVLNMPKEIIDILGVYEEDKVTLSLDVSSRQRNICEYNW